MSANTRHVHILHKSDSNNQLHCCSFPLCLLLLFSPSCHALLAQARPTMQRILLVIRRVVKSGTAKTVPAVSAAPALDTECWLSYSVILVCVH